jgi:hypothetical protein
VITSTITRKSAIVFNQLRTTWYFGMALSAGMAPESYLRPENGENAITP